MALRDLFPSWSRRAGEPESTPELCQALTELARLAARPELAEPAATLEGVLRAAFGGPSPATTTELHAVPDLILAAWRAGVPAFRAGDSPPALDPDDLRRRALAVAEALRSRHPDAPRLARALAGGTIEILPLWQESLSGNEEALDEAATAADVTPAFLGSALRVTLLPSLAACSARLAALHHVADWNRGECPHCGGPPVLAESRGLEQRRYLRCGLCAADWPADRLRCPFCGEDDHRQLSHRYFEGEEDRLRLVECASCDGRLKVFSTLAPLSAPGLLVAELAAARLE